MGGCSPEGATGASSPAAAMTGSGALLFFGRRGLKSGVMRVLAWRTDGFV
jgi:hypothetical protein